MNRELKFRAWDSKKKEMILPPLPVESRIGPYALQMNGTCYVNGYYQDQLIWMQFTGLQDSEGVDIYEGDILDDKWRAKVYWKNGSFWVSIHVGDNADSYLHGFVKSREQAKCPVKVIGNIHQNPELLK